MRRAVIAAVLVAVGCATPGAPPPLMRAPDYAAGQIRHPALFVRVDDGAAAGPAERESLAARYESSLVEAFDERGVPLSDVQRVAAGTGLEHRRVLARAREVRADHAVIVELRLERRDAIFCRGGRRPFAAPTTVWAQGIQVLRVQDGASRMAVPPGQGLDVTELDPDCANPRQSRLRDRAEMIGSAVELIAERILGR
jgi:hypothetical protein